MSKPCAKCPMRAKYDRNPKSFVGKFWRWHINFCPGWKSYFNSLTTEDQQTVRSKYNLTRR
ncbi:MAG: hypothetical protein RSC11_04160 [Mucinivorans sp.]